MSHPFRRFLPLLLLLALLLAACRSSSTPTPDASLVASGQSGGAQQLLVLPDDGIDPVLALIDDAGESIRFKIYLLTQSDIKSALIRAANRGVDVRVIIEDKPVGGSDSNELSFDQLLDGGVDVRWAPPAYRLTHEKSLVVDDQQALIATFNFTNSSFTRNREYGLLSDEPQVVSGVAAVFDADWEGATIEPGNGSPLVLSPVNSRATIESLIDGAQKTLWLEQATLLDDEVADRLVGAVRRGVDVRFIGPLREGEDDYARANYERLREAGAEVALLADPIIHAKVILADDTRALIGSINLTLASMDLNRELGIVTEDPAVLGRLRDTIERDWQQANQVREAPSGVISWQEAGDYVGAVVTVEGDIVRSYDSGKVTFLNFSDNYRDTLSIVIFPSLYGRFPELPAGYFLDQRIRASGIVKIYQGAPEIVVESANQIEIVGAADSQSSGATQAAEPTPEPTVSSSQAPQIVSWEDAGDYIGETITVEGRIVRTYDSGKVTFLNFSDDWQGTMSIVIFASDYDKFSTPPELLFPDQMVHVTGKVKEYKGAPEIIVESPEQIVILDAAAVNSAPAPAAQGPPTGVVSWQNAGDYVGQVATVSGRIVRANDTGSITFLNFSKKRDQFVAVVFAEEYGRFSEPPAQLYDGKEVWITGEISSFKGVPQIVVKTPDQIEVFD